MPVNELNPETFALALKAHRERLGFSQAEAAAHCRVTPETWSEWENETTEPLYPTMLGALQMLKFTKAKKN